MGDEDVAEAKDLATGERRQVTQVEQQRASLEHEFDVQGRITAVAVDELRMEGGLHGQPLCMVDCSEL